MEIQSTKKVTNNHHGHRKMKMLKFEREKKSLLMEMKEMKSMINEMKFYMGGDNDDHDVIEVHQIILALNKTSEELETKQRQASDELNLALKKLTNIAMKYNSSSSTERTAHEQNIAYEKAMIMAEHNKIEAENFKRRVLELEKHVVDDKNAMELEMEQLREAKKLSCDEILELKKEIDELKSKLKQKELDLLEGQEALKGTVKETENLQCRVNELEKQLEDKKKLELENEQLKATLNGMNNRVRGGMSRSLGPDYGATLKTVQRVANRRVLTVSSHHIQ